MKNLEIQIDLEKILMERLVEASGGNKNVENVRIIKTGKYSRFVIVASKKNLPRLRLYQVDLAYPSISEIVGEECKED